MKICVVGLDSLPLLAPRFARGAVNGESVQRLLLARALARRGHEISMVVADHGQPDGAQWERIRTFKVRRAGTDLPWWRSAALWPALARADADFYYADCTGRARAHLGLLALFCARTGKRYVLRAAREVCGASAGGRQQALVLRRASAILVPDRAAAQSLARNHGRPGRVARRLVEAQAAAPARDVDLLWVGNIRAARRPDRMITLARRLPQARVHMAGGPVTGEEALFHGVRNLAQQVSNLTFHGPLGGLEMNELYGRARLLVSTADAGELPGAFLQAWAHGVPVVTLADPDGLVVREGLGIAAAAPYRLGDALRRLLGDEAAWRAASARCTAYMAREYGEDEVLRPYLDAFDEALRGGPPTAGVPPESTWRRHP